MKLRCLALPAVLALALAACGGEDEALPIDSPAGAIDAPDIDGAPVDGPPRDCADICMVDAPPIDAPVDAPSSVQVVSCVGLTPAATIAASNFMFAPQTTTITAGQVIRVTVTGSHTFTSLTGLFDTTIGQDTCVRFTAAGTFPYRCTIHPSMTGEVVVN